MDQDEALEVAERVARSVAARSRSLHPSFDADDVEQEARVIAWTAHESGQAEHPARLARLVRWRLYDWLRSTSPLALRTDPIEIDPPDLSDPYGEVEDHDAVQRIIARHNGPPWHVEVALLLAHGTPATDVARHYGVSPSRVSHVAASFYERARAA